MIFDTAVPRLKGFPYFFKRTYQNGVNKKAPPGKHSAGGAKHFEQKMENRWNQTAWLTIFDSLDILRAAVFL
jgi:hypothetical protein